jgi:DNA anti-recombination protein RmuC
MEASDEAARKDSLNKHAVAQKSRVRELSSKRYWEKLEQTPGFVVMFIPNEACLGAAFEVDPDLLDFAFDRNVFVRFEELGVARADLKAPEPIVENLRFPFDYAEG